VPCVVTILIAQNFPPAGTALSSYLADPVGCRRLLSRTTWITEDAPPAEPLV